MREYPVPFSTREDAPFIFGLTIREMLWIGSGFFIGIVLVAIGALIIGLNLKNTVLCLPVIVIFAGIAFYMAKKQIKEDDHHEKLDKHLIKKLKYNFKTHRYLSYRREENEL